MMDTLIDIAKKNTPKKLHGLIETYGVAFAGAEQQWVLSLVNLLVVQKTREFKEAVVAELGTKEKAAILEKESSRMAALCKSLRDIERAREAFWAELQAIFISLLAAWLTQISGVVVW